MGRGGDAERASLWPGKRLSLPLILLNGSSMPPHLGAPENLGFLGRAEALVARWLSRAAISHCDSSAECECKGTAFFWHGNGLSPDLWGSCPLTSNLRMHNPFYGLSPASAHLRRLHSYLRMLRSLSAGPPFLWFFSPYATILRCFY